MTRNAEAFDILRAEGHAVGTPDPYTGRVLIWIRGAEEAISVECGTELHDLAHGLLTFDEIRARREDEAAADRD